MASKRETVDEYLELLAPLNVRARAMFGEYGVYCDDKFVGLVCEDMLFLKPTSVDDPRLGDVLLAPAYPGARDSYRFSPEDLADDEWLRGVFQATADALPARKPKPRKRASH